MFSAGIRNKKMQESDPGECAQVKCQGREAWQRERDGNGAAELGRVVSGRPPPGLSGSEVREGNRINSSGSGEGRGKEIKMLKNDIAGHKLNVDAIIRNINTISLELKKMKVAAAAATAKGKRAARPAHAGQSPLLELERRGSPRREPNCVTEKRRSKGAHS